MKKIYLLLTLIVVTAIQMANAQAPQGIPYQAVARDNAGNLIKSQPISLRFSIHDVTASGTVVYSETHTVTTDALGLFSVNIGGGTATVGTLAGVNWGTGAKYTQVELDVTGGSNYTDMGTTKMMSVPYALFAGTVATTMGAIGASSTANGATITSGVLSLAPADGTNGGIVTASAQTFGGKKTFADSAVAKGFRATDSLTTKGFRATGTATANSFVKTLGTSSQYLMADGSTSNLISLAPVAGSSTSNGATLTNGILSLAPANETNSGVVTYLSQTFGGKKTFADSAVAKGFRATDSLTTKGFRASGTATANSFVKTNGTSSQYLMADGSTSTISKIASSTPVAMPTIQIGNQLWSKNNLDVSFYRNGDEIPYVDNATTWVGLTTGAWCYYNNDPANGEKYGKLYNWYAVNDARGLAPQGWHIPSDAEWTILTTKLGESPGGKMKTAGTTNWSTPNIGATNSSGFAGLPGGCRLSDGTFNDIGFNGFWWSSTEYGTTYAWSRTLYNNFSNVYRYNDTKRLGFSVRCLRD